MAQVAGSSSHVSVISPHFCVDRPVDLVISVKKWKIIGHGDFVINDVNSNLMFKVEGSYLFSSNKVIIDANGLPIVTLKSKTFTAHGRWLVFKGESTNKKDLIFSVITSSTIKKEDKLHVFLANNISEDVCDYTIKGSWLERSCQVYVGNSSTKIAQLVPNSSLTSKITGKDRFSVMVEPNVDYAFIVALIVLFFEICSPPKTQSSSPNVTDLISMATG